MVTWVRRLAMVGVLCLGLFTAVAGASGLAAAQPETALAVTWQLSSTNIDTGQHPSVVYSVTGAKHGSDLFVQRRFTSGETWRSIAAFSLDVPHGYHTIPAVTTGLYHYRVVVTTDKREVFISGARSLYVFGPVSLTTLCQGSSVVSNLGDHRCPYAGTAQVGDSVFPYEATDTNSNVYPKFENVLDFPATTCRSISITFGLPANYSYAGDVGYLQIISETLGPQAAQVDYGELATLNASLDGHNWYLESAISFTETATLHIVLSAVAQCYTTTGY